jgi:hypothetical protein
MSCLVLNCKIDTNELFCPLHKSQFENESAKVILNCFRKYMTHFPNDRNVKERYRLFVLAKWAYKRKQNRSGIGTFRQPKKKNKKPKNKRNSVPPDITFKMQTREDAVRIFRSNPKCLADLEKQYRKLAIQYHPDRNAGNQDSETKMKLINSARSILLKSFDTINL